MDKPNSENRNQHFADKSELEALKVTLQKLNRGVRVPITGIIELASLLIEDDKDEVKVRTADLKMMKESAESVISIIDGALAGNGRARKSPKSVDVNEVMGKLNQLYHSNGKQKSL